MERNPSFEATPYLPLSRGVASCQGSKSIHLDLDLHCLMDLRGSGLSLGWSLKRGSTVYVCIYVYLPVCAYLSVRLSY